MAEVAGVCVLLGPGAACSTFLSWTCVFQLLGLCCGRWITWNALAPPKLSKVYSSFQILFKRHLLQKAFPDFLIKNVPTCAPCTPHVSLERSPCLVQHSVPIPVCLTSLAPPWGLGGHLLFTIMFPGLEGVKQRPGQLGVLS